MDDEEFQDVIAWAFKSPMSLAQILKALNDQSPYQWIERDSHYFGDYISATPQKDCRLRIFVEEDHYALDVDFESTDDDAEQQWEAFKQKLQDELLPLVKASDIEETENYG
jgi:hypothetical protein